MSTPSPAPATPTRTRWLIIGLLYCTYVLMFIDRINISIAAKYIMPEYGLSEVQFGWIFSAFVLGYAVSQIPGGWLGDRFGPRGVMAAAILWWSFFTAVTALAGELFLASLIGIVGSFLVVRVLIGIGEAVAPPNGNRVIANWAAARERGLAVGIAVSGSSLGGALTPPFIVWVMVTWGWRAAFYIAGAAGIVLALVWYWLVRDRPEQHPWVNAAEREYIAQAPTAGDEPEDESEDEPDAAGPALGPVPWRALLSCPSLWLMTAAYTVLGYIGYIYLSWFYLYLVNVLHFSVESGGLYGMAPFVAGAIGAPFGGWLTDRLSQRFGKRIGRCGVGFVSLLLTAGLIAIGASVTNPYLAVLFLALGAGTLFLGVAAYFATTIDLAKTYAGTLGGFMNMGGNLGGTLSPTLTPLLAQHYGWDSALYTAAGLAAVASLFWLGVHPQRPIRLEAA